MTNEMRLLTAFIKAQGYEIEVIGDELRTDCDYKLTKIKKTRKTSIKEATYTDEFETFWKIYPKRAGNNPKQTAFMAWQNNLGRGLIPASSAIEQMEQGAIRYKKFCDATDKTGTEFVLMASTFLGRQQSYLEPWKIPVSVKTKKLPGDEYLADFASKNNLPAPSVGQSYSDYRKKLTGLMEKS